MKIAIVIKAFRENLNELISCAYRLSEVQKEKETYVEVWQLLTEEKCIQPQDVISEITELIGKRAPDAVILEADAFGNEAAVRLRCAFNSTYVLNIEAFDNDGGKTFAVRRAYASNLFAKFELKSKPYFLTAAKGIFDGDIKKENTEVIDIKVRGRLPENCLFRSYSEEKAHRDELENADIIFAGGRGLGSRERAEKLKKTALLYKAAAGSSRPPVLDAWMEHWRLIGASGKRVNPKLLVTFGISGLGPFAAGIEKCEIIAAVNKDPEALIFKNCDYGIIGDAGEALDTLENILVKGE